MPDLPGEDNFKFRLRELVDRLVELACAAALGAMAVIGIEWAKKQKDERKP